MGGLSCRLILDRDMVGVQRHQAGHPEEQLNSSTSGTALGQKARLRRPLEASLPLEPGSQEEVASEESQETGWG